MRVHDLQADLQEARDLADRLELRLTETERARLELDGQVKRLQAQLAELDARQASALETIARQAQALRQAGGRLEAAGHLVRPQPASERLSPAELESLRYELDRDDELRARVFRALGEPARASGAS